LLGGGLLEVSERAKTAFGENGENGVGICGREEGYYLQKKRGISCAGDKMVSMCGEKSVSMCGEKSVSKCGEKSVSKCGEKSVSKCGGEGGLLCPL
jgi:hypothetical protein